MRRPSLACFAALALLTTSAGAQPPPPKPPALPAAAPPPSGPSSIEVNDPMLTPMPPPAHVLQNWQDIITQINGRSQDVIIAKAEIDRARGLWRQALALALPSITATGLAQYDIFRGPRVNVPATQPGAQIFGKPPGAFSYSPADHTVSGTLTATVPVFALKTWNDIGTADRAIKVNVLLAEDKQRIVLGSVADSIVAVVTAERVAEVNRVGLRSSLQTLELTQRKQRLGSGTQLDVVRASQDVSTARATLITGDEALRKAREALGIALGYNDDWGVTQGVSLDELGASFKRICSPAKPEERTDVLAAKAQVAVDKNAVRSTYLAYVPTVAASTTATAGNTSLNSGNTIQAANILGTGNSYFWNIQGVITWQIWEGGARYGATRIAKVQEFEDKARLDLTTRSAELQTTQAFRNVDVATSSRDVAIQTRDLAKETARLSQVAFEAGTGTSFDLVTSQALARQAELNLANAEFAVIQAKIEAMLAAANCKY